MRTRDQFAADLIAKQPFRRSRVSVPCSSTFLEKPNQQGSVRLDEVAFESLILRSWLRYSFCTLQTSLASSPRVPLRALFPHAGTPGVHGVGGVRYRICKISTSTDTELGVMGEKKSFLSVIQPYKMRQSGCSGRCACNAYVAQILVLIVEYAYVRIIPLLLSLLSVILHPSHLWLKSSGEAFEPIRPGLREGIEGFAHETGDRNLVQSEPVVAKQLLAIRSDPC
ncbi:hypothetical protein WN943_013275 [Citrus x changshan-huyou]